MEGRLYKFVDPVIFRSKRLVSKKLLSVRYQKKPIKYFVWARDSIIPKSFLNKRIAVHAGNRFHSFIVRRGMVGHKFGEFSLTKRLGGIIHIKKVKKKKGGKRR